MIFSLDRAGSPPAYPESIAGGPIAVIAFNHSGSADGVERDTAGLRRGPEPVVITNASQSYLEVQTAHDLVLGWGSRSFIKGLMADDMRPEALDELVEMLADRPGEALD